VNFIQLSRGNADSQLHLRFVIVMTDTRRVKRSIMIIIIIITGSCLRNTDGGKDMAARSGVWGPSPRLSEAKAFFWQVNVQRIGRIAPFSEV